MHTVFYFLMDMKISEETATAINSLAGDINNGFCLLR
jgi:hypothetical protein